MKRINYKTLVGLLALAVFSLGAVDKSGGLFETRSSLKSIGVVERADLFQQVTVAGMVAPLRRTLVNPPFSAYVRKLYVKLGDYVKQGDPLVTLTPSLRDHAEDAFPLRAPFSGRVVQVLHSEGEYVEEKKDNSPLLRIDDLNQLFIQSDVGEADINKIREGQEVLIRANSVSSRTYKGIIRSISLAAKEKKEWSRSGDRVEFETRMEVLDKDDQIRPGMSAIVDIITAHRKKVLTLAQEYIQKVDDDYFVTLENGEKRKISIGLKGDENFEILSGLKEKDRIRLVDFYPSES
jgi:multidrug efflux pump subunit AcrA (membrane-fusion protein)